MGKTPLGLALHFFLVLARLCLLDRSTRALTAVGSDDCEARVGTIWGTGRFEFIQAVLFDRIFCLLRLHLYYFACHHLRLRCFRDKLRSRPAKVAWSPLTSAVERLCEPQNNAAR